jgi:hypothetical protein
MLIWFQNTRRTQLTYIITGIYLCGKIDIYIYNSPQGRNQRVYYHVTYLLKHVITRCSGVFDLFVLSRSHMEVT